MNSNLPRSLGRSRLVSTALAALVVVLALVFRAPLTAWFTGKSMSDSAGVATSLHVGPYSVLASLDPDPPGAKDQVLVLKLRDAADKPVDDATVAVDFDMPAMGAMAEMKGNSRVDHPGDGEYRARFDLPMEATWTLKANITSKAGQFSQRFTMTVGNKGLSPVGGAMASGAPAAMEPAASGSASEIDHYTCSMHPSVKQAGPGKCPICGMDLVPVSKEQQSEGVVMIDEGRRQLIGVRTSAVIEGPLRSSFHAVGHVAYDESAFTDVNLKVKGWITKLLVNETGQRVARGQTLFTMYSPELYNAEQDFLLANRGSGMGSMQDDAGAPRVASFAHAARKRLNLLGLSDAQIDAVAAKGEPQESTAVASPASGFVIEKDVVEGASVDAGMRLFRIAALNKVWVEADVYEADLARVRVGQPAKVTLDYLPGRSYDAKVSYVYPYLEMGARTGRVRIELANKELELRPGMYASVELASDMGSRVQVPASAIVYTGPRRLVFVDLGAGRFRPQEVRVGTEADGMYEVLEGLQAGDMVATSGVFLIAAEARISTAAKYWDSEPVDSADAGASTPMAAPAPATQPDPMQQMKMTAPMHGQTQMARPAMAPPAAPSAMMMNSAAPSAGFTCPMHPSVKAAGPGKCPICGMDLVPTAGGAK
jgi:multidrug efflux pump subunit AcrA (membrane-fusion protein)